jgi:excisionase family DNA binding protein
MDTTFEHRNYTINEAAEHLRISRSMIYRLVEAKKLTLRKIGSRSIVTSAELARFLDNAGVS